MATTTLPYFVSAFPSHSHPATTPITINESTSSFSSFPSPSTKAHKNDELSTLDELSPLSIPLPFLTFSSELKLTSINEFGLKIFGEGAKLGTNMTWFLMENGDRGVINRSENEESMEKMRKQMIKFAQHTKTSISRNWDEGLPIDYFTNLFPNNKVLSSNSTTRNYCQAEVIVQAHLAPSSTSTSTPTSTLAETRTNSSNVEDEIQPLYNTPPESYSIAIDSPSSISPVEDSYSYSILFIREIFVTGKRSSKQAGSSKHSRSSSLATNSSLGIVGNSRSGEPRAKSPFFSRENDSQPLNTSASADDIPSVTRAKVHNPQASTSRNQRRKKESGEESVTHMEIDDDLVEGERAVGEVKKDDSFRKYFNCVNLLQEPELELYRDIIENIPIICWVTNSDGIAVYCSPLWYSFTGMEREAALRPDVWISYFHPADIAALFEAWEAFMEGKAPFEHEYRIRRYDGCWRWVFSKSTCIKDSSNSVGGWTTSVVEISELIDSRNEALRIQKSISAVLLGADIVLLSVDRSSIVTLFEGSATAALRAGFNSLYPDVSCKGKSLASIWPDERLGLAIKKILNENMDAADWLLETEAEQEGGMTLNKHCYRYRLVPIKGTSEQDPEVIGVNIVVADVTQLVNVQRELEVSLIAQRDSMAAETAANEASRLKTEFVTNISHEIRTPIAVMMGIFETLLDEVSLTLYQRGLVEQSFRSGEILLGIVGMVLDMGKLVEAGKLIIENVPFRLSDVLDDAALWSMMAKRKSLHFIEDIGTYYGGILLGDRVRLTQCFSNALSNAIKFTKPDGSITFEVRQESESDTECVLVFNIRDTGIGIPDHILPTLFVPFQQADTSTAREYGGTGLGLAISKNLVELMGGTAKLTSELGIGTTISFRILIEKGTLLTPGSTRRTSIDLPTLSENRAHIWEGTKILLAEDNSLIQELCKSILQRKKFTVEAVSDGLAAVEAVKEGDFDLILMDGQMPKLDGYKAAEAIRLLDNPKKRNIKIIALTASAFKGDKERCLNAGMDDYLTKPVRAQVLEAMIWEYLRGDSSKTSWRY